MADIVDDVQMDTQEIEAEIENETPLSGIFVAPSINRSEILKGNTYSHYSPIPEALQENMSQEVVLGVDEAGRGPVLGPMVYALFYLPTELHHSLLATTHHFDDSKVLTPEVRSSLMRTLCTPDSDLHRSCGWATSLLSARDISAHSLAPTKYNLNAQAMDATINLIKEIIAKGVNVKEIYIDTIGRPETYQKKLERIWPTIRITVAKKADSLYPAVSAASVCAKVTRDAALEVCYEPYKDADAATEEIAWGSGYPSDARTITWLKQSIDPVFGWGNECRFSWGTAQNLLEGKTGELKVDWPVDDDNGSEMRVTDFFVSKEQGVGNELVDFYGKRVTEEMECF